MKYNLFFGLIFLAIAVDSTLAVNQFLRLYSDASCGGIPVANFTDFYDYYAIHTAENTVRSFKVLGMWEVTHNSNRFVFQYGASEAGTCVTNYTAGIGTVFAYRYGEANMVGSSFPTLYLFPSPSLTGNVEPISQSANLPDVNYTVMSYWFTGTRMSWLAYPNTNFSGTPTCIEPSATVKSMGWGHTFDMNFNMTIRSIRSVSSCPTENNSTAQFLQLYTDTNCGGTPVAYFSNDNHNYTIQNASIPVRSFKVLGLWGIIHSGTRFVTQYGVSAAGYCVTNFTASSGIINVQRYGEAAMTQSALHLYSFEGFEGTEQQVSQSANLSSINYDVRSYWLTGTSTSWLAYPNANYSGTPTCIEPSATVKNMGWGHTYTLDMSFIMNIRSIRAVSSCPTGNGNNNTATLSQSLSGITLSAIAFMLCSIYSF